MGINIISYDLLNRQPSTSVSSGEIQSELRENTAIEQLMRRQGLLTPDEQPTFYIAPYSKYINVDDLTNQAPAGTVLLATSSAQLYFGSPFAKAAIKTLMPLETQIPGYARGLFAKGQSQSLERPLKVLVVNDQTGKNNAGIPEQLIRNIVADGSSVISRSVGEQMQLIEAVGLSQVRGFSLDPAIGAYYIKGTVTPLNIEKYFASHDLDVDVDIILTTSMLKGMDNSKAAPQLGIQEVDPQDLFLTRTLILRQTTAKLGTVQNLYATGLAEDVAIPTQGAIQDLQQKQMDLITLAEDYVRTFKISQEQGVLNGKPEVELPGNIAFIDAILASKNWGLLELPSVRANLQEYVNAEIKNINQGAIPEMRGEYRPLIICGDLKHNQIAGAGLTTGDKHVVLRFPVLNRGQVQAMVVNNDIPIFENPELGAVVPDAIYIGRQTLAEIEREDPTAYQEIVKEFGSVAAAQASWRTNLEAMKADFDGDNVCIFSEKVYPNFYAEVVENLTPEKLMHFVSKDKKQLIQSEDLPGMVVERLKDYVGIINSNLTKINQLYSSLDFIIASAEGKTGKELIAAEQLKADTLQVLFESYNTYKTTAPSVVEIDVELDLKTPTELEAAFRKFKPFCSIDFLKQQEIQYQTNYLHSTKDDMGMVAGAYKAGSLVATPVNSKQGIKLSVDLLGRMESLKYMKLSAIAKGEADPQLLPTYLDNYAKIYTELSQVIDLTQQIESRRKIFNPNTNLEDLEMVREINVVPNYSYDPTQIDRYLRDYQTIVLRQAIEIVDKENQRSVDFVKSGVKPDEGRVYSVTLKLPDLDVGIPTLKNMIIQENHQDRLPPQSNMTFNAILSQLRSVEVSPEIKSVVANFRADYQRSQETISLERQTLDMFPHGKPIALNISTANGGKIVLASCNVEEINQFRKLEGKGAIEIQDKIVTFFPDNTNERYTLGMATPTSTDIVGKQQIQDFKFEIVYNRISELQAESRQILANFREVVEQRGWDKQEVFAGIAQLAGEKAISQDFLLSALPDTLREFVAQAGSYHIIKTDKTDLLSKPTEYFVQSIENGKKRLLAKVEIDGKRQWDDKIGELEAYGSQLLDRTTFTGSIVSHYNQATFNVSRDSLSQTVLVGKITNAARELIDSPQPKINELRLIRTAAPIYQLNFEDTTISVSDLSPKLAEMFGEKPSSKITLERLNIYDNKFAATTIIDDERYYLSGVNASATFEKKNRETVTEKVRQENFDTIEVKIDRTPGFNYTYSLYNEDIKLGEVTQRAEVAYWEKRFDELKGGTSIDLTLQSVAIKQIGIRVDPDKNTIFNNGIWSDVAPAITYKTGKEEDRLIKGKTAEQLESAKERKGKRMVSLIKAAGDNLQSQAETHCFPKSFSVKVTVPIIDEMGLKEVELLQVVAPNNKLSGIEAYFNEKGIDYTKLERGIPVTYEETSRGYTVLRVDPQKLTPQNKTRISKDLGKPIAQADYEAKLADIPITNKWTPIKLNKLKATLEQHPPSTKLPVLDFAKAKAIPFNLRPITSEVSTRFKAKAVSIDNSIVFEFINARQRDTAIHHLGLPLMADVTTDDGKTRYFGVVETGALFTYINDRSVARLSIPSAVNKPNPILQYHAASDMTKLRPRSETDIMMGFRATKYIGIPLASISITTKYRDAWGENANVTKYKSEDVVMVTGNRSGKDTSNELLAQHFRTQYLPLINAAVQGKSTIVFGSDGGIDMMLKNYLNRIGSDVQLNSAGFFEADTRAAVLDMYRSNRQELISINPQAQPKQSQQEGYSQ
jgi:hypothetical protein